MKYNINDWVEVTYANGTRIIAQVSSETTIKENGSGMDFPTTVDSWDKWKPKQGDWCWFHNGNGNNMIVAKFDKMRGQEFKIKSHLPTFTMCEPFFGKLPSFLGN